MADMGSWRKIQIQVTEFQLPKWGGHKFIYSCLVLLYNLFLDQIF